MVVGSNPALRILGKASSSVGRARTKTHPEFARVVELVDTLDLESSAERFGGSTPPLSTKLKLAYSKVTHVVVGEGIQTPTLI